MMMMKYVRVVWFQDNRKPNLLSQIQTTHTQFHAVSCAVLRGPLARGEP